MFTEYLKLSVMQRYKKRTAINKIESIPFEFLVGISNRITCLTLEVDIRPYHLIDMAN